MISRRRSLRDDLAAVNARARAHVDDIIGGQDRVFVMLDDDHRIAEIAQTPQRLQQTRVVALMQADRGLVEHIKHAREAGADLRGQTDALAFAARQRARTARQRQIIETDVDEEIQPVDDFLEDAPGDFVALCVELARQRLEPLARRAYGELAKSRRYA